MKSLLTAAILLLAACTSLQTPDSANPQRKAAREKLERGIALYQQHDYAAAQPLIKAAADAGDMKAPRYLGLMYFYGNGLPQSAEKAFAAFKQGAREGDITSQYWLGYLYEHGTGTPKNPAQAFKWYQASAGRGDKIAAPAMLALSRFYQNGTATAKNEALAAEYRSKALPLLRQNEGGFLSSYPKETY